MKTHVLLGRLSQLSCSAANKGLPCLRQEENAGFNRLTEIVHMELRAAAKQSSKLPRGNKDGQQDFGN